MGTRALQQTLQALWTELISSRISWAQMGCAVTSALLSLANQSVAMTAYGKQ